MFGKNKMPTNGYKQTQEHKNKVRKWAAPENPYKTVTRPISDHVFGHKTRIVIPKAIENKVGKPDSTVAEHLNSKGFNPDEADYHKGVTYSYGDINKKRPLKIGKILEQTKAPEHIKKAFMNDPYRGAAKAEHLQATVSRHPFDVAGASTDRGWTSCIDMTDKRPYKNKLKDDIENGTHVAYLHHKNDPTISHPLSRISLKPFNSSEGSTILRPESITYGMSNPGFHKAVSDWSKKHFPMKDNVIYTKNRHVYDDDARVPGTSSALLRHTDASVFKRNTENDLHKAAQNAQLKDMPLTHNDVKDLLSDIKPNHTILAAHTVRNMRKEDLHHLGEHANASVRKAAAERYDEMPDATRKKLLSDTPEIRHKVAGHSEDSKTLARLAQDKNKVVANSAGRNLVKVNPDYALNHRSAKVRQYHAQHAIYNEDDMQKHLKDPNAEVRNTANERVKTRKDLSEKGLM